MKSSEMINITVDHRESKSKVLELLSQDDRYNLSFRNLSAGDYVINDVVCIERKTSVDLILSIMSGRIFSQCAQLKKQPYRNLVMIEGDPFDTRHDINPNAIRGALLSIVISWEIPVILCQSTTEFIKYINIVANQQMDKNLYVRRGGYKPKRIRSQQLFFIQGLPGIGAALAKIMLDHFKSILVIVNASEEALMKVPGVGKKKAKRIFQFINSE